MADAPISFLFAMLTVITVGLTTLIISASLFARKRNYPSGPSVLPLLGNIIYWRRVQKNLEPELLRLKEQWGDICMLWLGRAPVMVINSPLAAKEILNEV